MMTSTDTSGNEVAHIPPPTRQRLADALQLARQAQSRYEELLVTVVETLGFDPKDPNLHVDLDNGRVWLDQVVPERTNHAD
jgi:hypothetical protein